MSSKVTSSKVTYTVEQAMVGEGQHPGKAEVVRVVGVAGAYGKPRASVTLDSNFGKDTHIWVRFSATTPELDTHMKAHGWHFSPKNRLGYHRVADAQSEALVSQLKIVPEAAVTQVQAPAKTSTPAPKSGSKVAGKVASAQEVAGKGKTTSKAATQAKASAPTGIAAESVMELLDRVEWYGEQLQRVAEELRKRGVGA